METNFSRSELLKAMREYSGPSVNRTTWVKMKNILAMNKGDDVFGILYENDVSDDVFGTLYQNDILDLRSRTEGKLSHFDAMSDPSLRPFFKYLRSRKNGMFNSVSVTSAELSNAIASATTALGTLDTKCADIAISSTSNNWGMVNSDGWFNTTTNINSLEDRVTNLEAKMNEKEKKNMENMVKFDFGKVTGDSVRISMYGIAVKSVDGRYVSYDAKSHSVMDVEIMNMPAGDFLYKMPVAIKDVKAGDVVIHNRVPMFVVETHESTLKVIDIREGTEKEIYLTKSPFGFNFATKVVSLMDMTGVKADETNPFGSMLPLMLMSNGKDFDPMMLMLMGQGNTANLMSNPMMLYFLMKDGNKNDMLPFMLMSLGSQSAK